jgi:hypothetical protein
MELPGRASGNDLYNAAIRAQAAVQKVHVNAQYAGCKHRVCKASEAEWPETVCGGREPFNGVAVVRARTLRMSPARSRSARG